MPEYKKLADAHLKEAKRKLERAEKLYGDSYYDEAAHNGYYSMYHAAKSLLALKKVQPKTHRGVILEIQRLYVKSKLLGQDLASSLSRGLQVRIQSDYDMMIGISNEVAKEVIDDAKIFLSEVEKLIRI